MNEFDAKSPAFRRAELRSERTRVWALLGVLAGMLVLVLVRGVASLAEDRRGEAWPFAVLLAIMTGYEAGWMIFIRRVIRLDQMIPLNGWRASLFAECLFPTAAVILAIHTPSVGPDRALTAPVVAVFFLFIILSALHLDAGLTRMAGVFAAIGYSAAASEVFLEFPVDSAVTYATSLSFAGLLLVGGYAAGSVAGQLRVHVLAALSDAENRAKIAELEHDMEIARSIQQGYLPKTSPVIDRFDIAGWNKPADETGGDYFDWQLLDDGRTIVSVADVTGHGIGPALCMAACRPYARAIFGAEPELQCAFASLNNLLYEDLPSEKFVTLAAGLLDPEKATLELISAGHGPLLFYLAAENRFRNYDAQGLPLGLMPDASYSSPHTLKFAHGDILALVTDGFIEWSNAQGEEFGQDRLKEVIRANRNRSTAAIISELYSSILAFAGSAPQQDDLTAVIVRRR